jgi:hypothetical protein
MDPNSGARYRTCHQDSSREAVKVSLQDNTCCIFQLAFCDANIMSLFASGQQRPKMSRAHRCGLKQFYRSAYILDYEQVLHFHTLLTRELSNESRNSG